MAVVLGHPRSDETVRIFLEKVDIYISSLSEERVVGVPDEPAPRVLYNRGAGSWVAAELIVADDEHEPANNDDEARIVAGTLPGIVADGGAGEPGMW